MIKYRLHNITNFGVEIHDFHTEKALNNYISVLVDPPYWVENLETGEKAYKADENLFTIDNSKVNDENVSCETLHESELQWINRHVSDRFIFDDTPIQEDEPFTLFDRVLTIIAIISVLIVAGVLGYTVLTVISYAVEYASKYNWWIFNIL